MKIKYNKEKDEEPKKNSDWFVPNKEYCGLFLEKNKEGIFFGVDTAALHPYKIFDILTHFIPYNWTLAIYEEILAILPKKWQSLEFWESYNNGEMKACEIFDEEVEKIYFSEFYDTEIVKGNKSESYIYSQTAQILDETWVMCPQCTEAWETPSKEIFVTCPKCECSLYNPRYTRENKELTLQVNEGDPSNLSPEQIFPVYSVTISEKEGAYFFRL
jgi:hypothetical protein